MSSWRGSECSEGFLVLKRSFTVSLSSLDVLFGSRCCVGLFCLGSVFCFCFVFGHPVFCFSPALQQLEIS